MLTACRQKSSSNVELTKKLACNIGCMLKLVRRCSNGIPHPQLISDYDSTAFIYLVLYGILENQRELKHCRQTSTNYIQRAIQTILNKNKLQLKFYLSIDDIKWVFWLNLLFIIIIINEKKLKNFLVTKKLHELQNCLNYSLCD